MNCEVNKMNPERPLKHLKRKLLVLDLNGTLLERAKTPYLNFKYEAQLNDWYIYLRPGARSFLKNYALRYFDVAIWSSATAYSVSYMMNIIFKGDMKSQKSLVFVWDREWCTPDRRPEQQIGHATFKDLEKVWYKFPHKYNRENTIAIDDTASKYLHHTENAVIIPPFSCTSLGIESMSRTNSFNCNGVVLSRLIEYLEMARKSCDVRLTIRSNSFMANVEKYT